MNTSNIFRNLGLLAAGVFLLAGCTWFNKKDDSQTVRDTAQAGVADQSQKDKVIGTVSGATDNGSATDTAAGQSGGPTGLIELTRPQLGFKVLYPQGYTLNESVSCVEGCPTGEEVPLFDLIGSQSHIAIEAYGSESRAVKYLGSGFNNVAGFMASGIPTQVKKSVVTGGTRYDFVLPGVANASPGIAPNTPDQVFVFFVAANGQTFGLSTPKNAGGESDLQKVADNFSFI